VNRPKAATRRAALAAFLLFAAALLDVSPAEASRTTTDARPDLSSASSEALAPSSPELTSLELVEPIDPVETSPRFGFAEDLGLLDPEAGPGGFVVFAAEAAQYELTYARNNPLKYVDPDGRLNREAGDPADDSEERNPCNDDPVPCGGEIARHDTATVTADAPTTRDALQEGVQTAAPVVEALGAGTVILTAAPAAGLLAPAEAMTTIGISLYSNAEVITGGVVVSRWGGDVLKAGQWVMKGEPTFWNFLGSGKYDPFPWNTRAAFSSGRPYLVPQGSLKLPPWYELWKAPLGQRIYRP
jgi:hypothetical protein